MFMTNMYFLLPSLCKHSMRDPIWCKYKAHLNKWRLEISLQQQPLSLENILLSFLFYPGLIFALLICILLPLRHSGNELLSTSLEGTKPFYFQSPCNLVKGINIADAKISVIWECLKNPTVASSITSWVGELEWKAISTVWAISQLVSSCLSILCLKNLSERWLPAAGSKSKM